MPKYRVYLTSTASTMVDVEADDPEAAEDRAYEQMGATLCHHCSRDIDMSGEWDVDEVLNQDEDD